MPTVISTLMRPLVSINGLAPKATLFGFRIDMSILYGAKGKIYFNGKVIGEITSVTVQPKIVYDKTLPDYIDLKDLLWPSYQCLDCDDFWNFSNADYCLRCKSTNIICKGLK
jgi:hypothetical protein